MSRVLRGLIFDFDGLIVDTETARYHAWKEVIESHGVELPLSVWHQNIGLPSEAFNPLDYLRDRAQGPIDLHAVRKRKNEVFWARMEGETLRPGIRHYLEQGKGRGLKMAICSSSPRRWIEQNLPKWGIDGQFDAIVTGSDVERIKPDPELYLKALDLLQLPAESCIAFEDSPKGVQSAKAAGLFCVAIPNSITLETDLAGADLKVHSLMDLPLEGVERRFSASDFPEGLDRAERKAP